MWRRKLLCCQDRSVRVAAMAKSSNEPSRLARAMQRSVEARETSAGNRATVHLVRTTVVLHKPHAADRRARVTECYGHQTDIELQFVIAANDRQKLCGPDRP